MVGWRNLIIFAAALAGRLVASSAFALSKLFSAARERRQSVTMT
jgi:hypothetical protein